MRLVYISVLAFLFVATFTLFVSKSALPLKEVVVPHTSDSSPQENLSPLPVLMGDVPFPALSAQAALAVDLNSGVSLYEKNREAVLLPASTTKIITALVAMDYYPSNRVVSVGPISVEGQKMGLIEGEVIRVRDLLYGLLIFSANDAAEVLAQNYPGGKERFIAAMNFKARDLNLESSVFTNPSGLETQNHVTSAEDLVRVSEVAMRSPLFRTIVGTKKIEVQSLDGAITHNLTNLNELVGEVDGVLGVKTGWTENAQENLVTYVEREDRKVMIALLGSEDRFGETRQLIDWIFENYEWREVREP